MIQKNKKMTTAELVETLCFLQVSVECYSELIGQYGEESAESLLYDFVCGERTYEELEYIITYLPLYI